MNYDRVSATNGTRAVDPRMLADDKFLKRMGNFERVCKQIDAKHDHVMEMLANIQEQLRNLEMKQRKERGAQFQIHTTAFKPPYLAVSRPQEIEVESKILPPNQCLSSLSYGSNDAEPEIEGFVEVVKHAPIISTVAVETYSSTTKATKIHERKVFDEIPESENSKISVISPLVHGSEIVEVYDFGVLNPQFQTPLVSTQEIKMEPEGLSLISSPSSFSSNSDGTKLEDEGSLKVPIRTTGTKLQPQELKSRIEVFPNLALVASKSINSIVNVEALSLPPVVENSKMVDDNSIHDTLCRDVRSRTLVQWLENFPNLKIMVGSLLLSPLLYKCCNGDGLITEELKWLDTGQYIFVSCFSRDGVVFDSIVSCIPVNEMYWNKNTLVFGMQLKDSWSEWGEIKIVVRGANNHEQNSGALRNQELVDCVSLYVMNFTCLAFAYDPGIYYMCWDESLVHFLKIQLDNSATSNHKIGLYGVKMVNNVSIFHNSLANPTVGLEDAIPLQEINSLHTAEGGQVDQDLMSALKEFGLAEFHFTANGFGNDPLHCFKVNGQLKLMAFDQQELLERANERITWHEKLEGEEAVQNRVHELVSVGNLEAAVSLLLSSSPESSYFYVNALRAVALSSAVSTSLLELAVKVVAANMVRNDRSMSGTHLLCAVGRFRKTVGHYKEKKNLEATLVFDPGDLDFFSLNIEDNSIEVVIIGGISIAFSSWYIVSGFYLYYQGSESNHYNYHSLGDVNVQQNCVAVFVGEAVEFEVVSIEVVTWGKKVGGSECPENQRNESGGLIASLWALEINFVLRLFELVVVATECQIFEAKLQVKTTTKSSLELDLTNEKQRLNCRLVLEDGFVCATVFEAYGCPE